MRVLAGAVLDWFTDTEDLRWTPWRGVIAWVLVVALICGLAVGATALGWNGSTSSPGACPPSYAATGGC